MIDNSTECTATVSGEVLTRCSRVRLRESVREELVHDTTLPFLRRFRPDTSYTHNKQDQDMGNSFRLKF